MGDRPLTDETIIVTSAGMFLGAALVQALPKPPSQVRLAHVVTAAKVEADRSYVDRDRQRMQALGFRDVVDIDLDGRTADEVAALLQEADIVYVQGGNTFFLLQAMRQCQFGTVIRRLLSRGVVYIGASAGSYVACPTIAMATWKGVDKNIVGLTDFTDLGLVPFHLFVHYQPKWDEVIRANRTTISTPLRILKDTQGLVVRNGRPTFIGRAPEVVLP